LSIDREAGLASKRLWDTRCAHPPTATGDLTSCSAPRLLLHPPSHNEPPGCTSGLFSRTARRAELTLLQARRELPWPAPTSWCACCRAAQPLYVPTRRPGAGWRTSSPADCAKRACSKRIGLATRSPSTRAVLRSAAATGQRSSAPCARRWRRLRRRSDRPIDSSATSTG